MIPVGIPSQYIKVTDLEDVGLSYQQVSYLFQQSTGRHLNLNETLRVSKYDEGKEIQFETFDDISIVVPVHLASGGFNKVIEP